LPGGGVEVGETFEMALKRELAEEANVVVDGPPILHGLFLNRPISRRDHVAVYVVRRFRVTGERAPDREIVEARFFPVAALPSDTTRGTRSRLEEALEARRYRRSGEFHRALPSAGAGVLCPPAFQLA